MKNYFNFYRSLIFVWFAIPISLSAQDYVVTHKGDTLKGNVKIVSISMNSSVKLTSVDKTKTNYTIFQVKSFSYKNEIYQPVKGPYGYVFMKLKKTGYLSLYAFQLLNQMTFDGLYLSKMDGTGMEVPNLNFKKQMSKFLFECESVASKIENGDFRKQDLDSIIYEFNLCIAKSTIELTSKISKNEVQTKKLNAWDSLEEKLKNQPDFEGKSSALEMVTDIKSKISRGDKVPNFITDALKNILNPTELKNDLENALKELN